MPLSGWYRLRAPGARSRGAPEPCRYDVRMFGNALQGWHIIIIVLVVLLLFGAPKLPALARSIGQSMRIFRSEVKTMKDENAGDESDADADAAVEDADAGSAKPTQSSKKAAGDYKPGTTKKPSSKQ